MDFNSLMAKMRELDQPASTIEACGDPVGAPPMGMSPGMPPKPDTPPPTMSINLNAQGLDNIEDLMSLIKAVNKDMGQPPMPPMSMAPSIEIEPMKLGNLDSGPLKMLPDLDKEEPDSDEGPDLDKDDDSDIPKKEKDEAFGNSVNDSEPRTMDVDAAIPDGNDLHKAKQSFSGKPYRGDNPMAAGAFESTDLRAQIRAELLQRLAEAKGAK